MHRLTRDEFMSNPLVNQLISLKLDPDDFVVFGSGPLFVHRIRAIDDLDVVVRGDSWKRVCKIGKPMIGPLNGALIMHLEGGKIEFSNGWIGPEWNVDKLIEKAEIFHGIRFACLLDVLSYKKTLGRPKDISDIRALEKHLAMME